MDGWMDGWTGEQGGITSTIHICSIQDTIHFHPRYASAYVHSLTSHHTIQTHDQQKHHPVGRADLQIWLKEDETGPCCWFVVLVRASEERVLLKSQAEEVEVE